MTIIDNDGKFLSKQEILELAKTKKGQKQLFVYFARARSAFATQRVLERLDSIPDEQAQIDVCSIIYETCFNVPLETVMEYISSMQEHLEEPVYHC